MSGHDERHVSIRQEADLPDIRRILRVALGTLVFLGLGVVASWAIMVSAQGPRPAAARRMTYANLERARRAGISIDERLINREDPGALLRARQRTYLESYGWVDRDAGIAHVPIEHAIEVRVREEQP